MVKLGSGMVYSFSKIETSLSQNENNDSLHIPIFVPPLGKARRICEVAQLAIIALMKVRSIRRGHFFTTGAQHSTQLFNIIALMMITYSNTKEVRK